MAKVKKNISFDEEVLAWLERKAQAESRSLSSMTNLSCRRQMENEGETE
jgi:hypothetical protein